MTALRLGSLCTGYGGLDLAAETLIGPLEHTWHAEIDPHASKVLAHHWPTTPNLGDLTAVDWTAVEPVDVLTAGYPCQPLSLAGRRAGLDDERWIWDDVFAAVRDLRPRLVLLENVAGHLSLGFGRVLGDLASAGFDAEWGCFRASDVGAPHRRERVFIAAWPADCPPDAGHLAGRVGVGAAGADCVTLLPTPRTSDTNGGGAHGTGGLDLRTAVSLLPTPRTSDTKGGPNQRGSSGDLMLPSAVVQLLPTPNAGDARQRTQTLAEHYEREARKKAANPNLGGLHLTLSVVAQSLPEQSERWGNYAPAIARWEAITGQPAPEATETGTKGQQRLAPAFVEWLMGLPAGWVTDHLPRNPALKCLGNGVVWQQAAHAYSELLAA